MTAPRSVRRAALRVRLLGLFVFGCGTPVEHAADAGPGESDATVDAGGVPLALPPGLAVGTPVAGTFRQEPAGAGPRLVWVVTTTLDAAAVARGTFTLPPPPPEAAPTHLHVALGTAGARQGIAYAALPLPAGEPLAIWPHRPDCDADDDGHYACRVDCCDPWPPALRPHVLDCLDDAATALRLAEASAGGPLLADAKRRRADTAHAFREFESPVDYFECGNGLDDACAGGDVVCQRRQDADQDGVPVGLDCDDGDPAIHPDAVDPPRDGVDANCDGRDAAGTDRDLDGITAEGRPADCDDTRPETAPGRADAPCDGLDDDCDGRDPCPPPGLTDADRDGVAPEGGDCDDEDPGRSPHRLERCGDGVDQNCDGVDPPCAPDDGDGDGIGAARDCDDADATRFPGAPERCDDAVDQDCDGRDLPCSGAVDRDLDGYPVPGDCADRDPGRHPGAPERCNGLDDDCDGVADEGPPGLDRDGLALTPCVDACGPGRVVCLEAGAGCRLNTPAAERCNGRDDDCDGAIDDGLTVEMPCYDGPPGTRDVGVCRAGVTRCADGVPQDCKGQVVPAATDTCDGLDDDCDGAVDETPAPCYGGPEGTRGVGVCHAGRRRCDDGTPGACQDETLPSSEACNGLDDDCDGTPDEGLVEPCGDEAGAAGVCGLWARTCIDGVWGPCGPEAGAGLERCDGLDDDCDGLVDEDFDFAADVRHCGGCNRACADGDVCCEGVCGDGPLCRPAPRPCADAAACPPDAPRCERGLCTACRAVDHEGCGSDALCCPVAGAALACVAGDVESGCEACGARCEPGAADRCVDRTCRCGDGPECVEPTPFCDPGRGACVECLVAADCENALGGAHCVEGRCRPCDGATHAGCGPQQLCCLDRCVAAAPAGRCEACAAGCNPDTADRCVDRACACGEGPPCASPERPFCVDGACSACREAADCGPGLRCEAGTCAGCGARTPCPGRGPIPVCEGGVCRPCAADAECVDPEVGHQCAGGACGACDPADAAGCLPGGPAPTCDASTRTCRPCEAQADCPPDRPVCEAGRCRVCTAADHAGCDEAGEAPLCAGGRCVPCASSLDCAARPGALDHCFAGRCVACHPGDGAGCDPAGVTPVCDALGQICRACRSDAECLAAGGGARCLGGACGP
ncbi:hypothetical protein L6V77_27800 [Myxococcota bacterium]|nr:hypothetical protein [Myxococcota bacterium]